MRFHGEPAAAAGGEPEGKLVLRPRKFKCRSWARDGKASRLPPPRDGPPTGARKRDNPPSLLRPRELRGGEKPQASSPLAGAGSDNAPRGGISAGELNEKAPASAGDKLAGADGHVAADALSESDRGGGGDTAAW